MLELCAEGGLRSKGCGSETQRIREASEKRGLHKCSSWRRRRAAGARSEVWLHLHHTIGTLCSTRSLPRGTAAVFLNFSFSLGAWRRQTQRPAAHLGTRCSLQAAAHLRLPSSVTTVHPSSSVCPGDQIQLAECGRATGLDPTKETTR